MHGQLAQNTAQAEQIAQQAAERATVQATQAAQEAAQRAAQEAAQRAAQDAATRAAQEAARTAQDAATRAAQEVAARAAQEMIARQSAEPPYEMTMLMQEMQSMRSTISETLVCPLVSRTCLLFTSCHWDVWALRSLGTNMQHMRAHLHGPCSNRMF